MGDDRRRFMNRGRIFLIDDHDAVLHMLTRVMHDIGANVVGTASTGAEGIPMVLLTEPDVLVLDLSMPDQTGFDIVHELRTKGAACRFLAFTGVVSMHAIERIEEMRLDGIVSKMSRIEELVEAVKAVLAGRTYACKLFTELRREHKERADHPARLLTPREVQVLALIGEAKTDVEIGSVIGLSATTVQGFRTKLLQKLNLSGTPQLVRFAFEHGYTEFGRSRGPST